MKLRSLAWKVLTGLVVGISTAALCLLLLWQMIVLEVDATSGSFGWLFVGIASSLGIVWATVIAHELGHLLAALAVRMRVDRVVIGPLTFVRDVGRFRLRITWRSTTVGYVAARPTDVRDIRRRMFLFISAGPLVNLMVGSLLLWAAIHGNESSLVPRRFGVVTPTILLWMPQSHPIAWLDFAAVMNLMLFVASLIPGTAGGLTTDGGQLLALLRGDLVSERQMLIFALGASSNNGVRPREWDGALIQRILAASDGSAMDVSANLYGYYHALDCGRLEEAHQRLDQTVTLQQVVMPEYRAVIFLESAYFLAFHRHDASAARSALDIATGGIAEKPTWLRAEAAVLLAEGQYEEAASKARAGLELLPQILDRGGAIAEEEWLAAILAECQERMDQTKASGQIPSL
jgi:Peptidase family M50